jgi:hypothetical protein
VHLDVVLPSAKDILNCTMHGLPMDIQVPWKPANFHREALHCIDIIGGVMILDHL